MVSLSIKELKGLETILNLDETDIIRFEKLQYFVCDFSFPSNLTYCWQVGPHDVCQLFAGYLQCNYRLSTMNLNSTGYLFFIANLHTYSFEPIAHCYL